MPELTSLSWSGRLALSLSWAGRLKLSLSWGGTSMLQIAGGEVRAGNVIPCDYQYLDADGDPVNLSTYDAVTLHVKRQGAVYATASGSVVSAANGTVTASHAFAADGVYDVQFMCHRDDDDTDLWGNILRVTVEKNVPDLALGRLAAG